MSGVPFLKFSLLLFLDTVLVAALLFLLVTENIIPHRFFSWAAAAVAFFLLVKAAASLWVMKSARAGGFGSIRRIISDFKRGRYITPGGEFRGDGEVRQICSDLTIIGRHFDDVVSTQKEEIEQLREMYSNTILSMSSYFLVLNDEEEVLFANESFCRKFQYDQEGLNGTSVDDIFFFLTDKLKESLSGVRRTGEPVVMEKTHLLSRNGISVIADIKLSRMTLHGKNQYVLVIDDITSRCRKDYQISLISQISESIQHDPEIEKVLYTILTGVTSGSGLGFNRAMMFLIDDSGRELAGKMAVGPDSLEEAMQIWSSIPAGKVDIFEQLKNSGAGDRKGQRLLESVLSARFPLKSRNVFLQAIENMESVHVHDSYNDERVDMEIRALMEVKEFLVVPLVAVNRAIGVIVADNRFNQMPITRDSIDLLSIFGFQTALSIESYKNLSMVNREMQKIRDRQDAIVESEKLAAVGRIALHIAHEIRNPLVTVGGYARRALQLSRDAGKNAEMIRGAAQVILKESERLEKVLSNVMDFTRPSPYIQQFNNINEIITDTIDLLRNLFQERRIGITMNLKKDVPLIKSDFNQMKQVMLNLVQNAIDATPAGGVVEISTDADAGYVRISVGDNGVGIREDYLDRVFEPFYTTKITGVGLGLAIVRKVISDHGGEITVKNRPGGGTQFEISLALP